MGSVLPVKTINLQNSMENLGVCRDLKMMSLQVKIHVKRRTRLMIKTLSHLCRSIFNGLFKMRIIADLHLHSRYSRATSEKMCIDEMERFAKIKGLNTLGTGDFTHPKWLKELQESLAPEPETGFYKNARTKDSPIHFTPTTEVNTIFPFGKEVKKIHHVIMTPSFETATQINDRLAKYGDLEVDGRATLDMSAPHLVEEVMNVSSENLIFPAHAWTPWFSIFGAFSGFNSIEDCYQDMTKHIHALETGLSSDPPMNWRLSKLDKFTLLSNSDSHSHWPWRIGREANVFELDQVNYHEMTETIRTKDTRRFKFTIETDPAYGKYHWTGHRSCHVSLSAQEAIKFNNMCPVCRKKLTKGVEQRVEELADRHAGFKPEDFIGYVHLMPLSEIIATVLDVDSLYSQKIWDKYNPLIRRFGNEYAVLLDVPMTELRSVTDEKITEAIIRIRNDRAKVIPGYDGVYGKLDLGLELPSPSKHASERVQQRNISDFLHYGG
jgi:uncharacterized protein (TIGR00375 family)